MPDPDEPPRPPRQYHVPAPEGTSGGRPAAPPPAPPPRRPPNPSNDPRLAAPAARPASSANWDQPPPPTPAGARTGNAPPPRNRGRSRVAPGRRAARIFRPKLRWLLLYLPLLLLLVVFGSFAWLYFRFGAIHRVELGDALAPTTGNVVNYLLVGSDSREGIDADTPNVGAIGTHVSGRRSDTIIVLRVEGGTSTMMSIPRDLWTTNVATGRQGRINAAYNQGPANLVRTVTANLGIPINHYLEVDFVSFSGMVDAIGGIDIAFPHAALDRNSGLNIIAPGVHTLDGSQALAYVRSRHYVEIIDGKQVSDPTADLGRNQRQQIFIRTVLKEVGATRNPWTLARVVGAATGGMRVDTALGFGDAVKLARSLSGSEPTSVVLPTRPARKGAASVLVLQTQAAAPVLAQFGGVPNTPS